jgi:hypothetical protein
MVMVSKPAGCGADTTIVCMPQMAMVSGLMIKPLGEMAKPVWSAGVLATVIFSPYFAPFNFSQAPARHEYRAYSSIHEHVGIFA